MLPDGWSISTQVVQLHESLADARLASAFKMRAND
jgi:hypothetical protein